MFKTIDRNSTPRPALGILAGIGAVLVVGAASPAFAQSRACQVAFHVTNATTLRALQFDIDYTNAADVGEFTSPSECTFAPAGLGDVGVDQMTNVANVGWANTNPAFVGPGLFVTCRFDIPLAASAVPALADFTASVTDAEQSTGVPASPMPTIAASSISCVQAASCSLEPETGCRHSTVTGKSKIQFKDNADNTKDQGQYQWKSGAATTLADLGGGTVAGTTYSWCVYSDSALVKGWDVASGTGWAASGTTGFQFKGDAGGISQIKMKSSATDGKASIQVKGKSKAGNFSAPTLPLSSTNVVSQFVIDNGVSPLCFESTFTAPTKNDVASYGSKD